MIEIITEEVELPNDSDTWRYQYDFKRPDGIGKWWVIDTHDENKIVYKGSYQDTMIVRYNLNKKFYRKMKVFYNTTFEGHWPVGTCALISAYTPKKAAQLLSEAVNQTIDEKDMIEFDFSEPGVEILLDGNY